MSFMDRAKAAAEQVRARAQEGVEEVQTRKELAQGYWDLGHKAYELASAGALSHPELDPLVQRMSELLAHEDAGESSAPPPESGEASTTTPPDTPA
jgi:hypothetical protein